MRVSSSPGKGELSSFICQWLASHAESIIVLKEWRDLYTVHIIYIISEFFTIAMPDEIIVEFGVKPGQELISKYIFSQNECQDVCSNVCAPNYLAFKGKMKNIERAVKIATEYNYFKDEDEDDDFDEDSPLSPLL